MNDGFDGHDDLGESNHFRASHHFDVDANDILGLGLMAHFNSLGYAQDPVGVAAKEMLACIKQTGSPKKAILMLHQRLDAMVEGGFFSFFSESQLAHAELKMNLIKAWGYYDKAMDTDYAYMFQHSTAKALCKPRSKADIENANRISKWKKYIFWFIIYLIFSSIIKK